MPGLFAKKDENAVSAKKLAMVWHTLDPVVQGLFEQLYQTVPAEVTRVLNGEVLASDQDHPTLKSWVESVPEGEGGDLFDSFKLRPGVVDVKVEPGRPDPGKAFSVSWTVSVDVDFPARKDRVDILDHRNGQVVAQTVMDTPEVSKGTSRGEAKFDGLPSGAYLVQLSLNTEGSESATPNDHGLIGGGGAEFFVGETRSSQIADDAPMLSDAMAQVNSLSFSTEPDKTAVRSLVGAARALASMDQLGDIISNELRRVADRLAPYEADGVMLKADEEWAPYRDRLVGAAVGANAESVAPFADTIVEVVDEMLSY